MADLHNNEIAMVLDYRKNRIRIYKSTLRAIGDPKYIQILVNPDTRILGVHTANRDDRCSMAILLSQDWKDPEVSYEVYSQFFLLKLAQLVGSIDLKTNYRLIVMERQQFKGITDFDKENTYGLFGIHDKSVNTYDLFRKYYKNATRFDGEHQLNEKVLKSAVLPLVRQILGI